MFGIFNDKKTKHFAEGLALEIAKRYPPAVANDTLRRISPDRVSSVLEDVFEKAKTYTRENKLGSVKKALIGNEFRWKLRELGYSKEFVEVATEGLIVYITVRAKQ